MRKVTLSLKKRRKENEDEEDEERPNASYIPLKSKLQRTK
jgi:hypothetical protein